MHLGSQQADVPYKIIKRTYRQPKHTHPQSYTSYFHWCWLEPLKLCFHFKLIVDRSFFILIYWEIFLCEAFFFLCVSGFKARKNKNRQVSDKYHQVLLELFLRFKLIYVYFCLLLVFFSFLSSFPCFLAHKNQSWGIYFFILSQKIYICHVFDMYSFGKWMKFLLYLEPNIKF